jgi:omega-6 fatty acid desaturase (delta-12 desaturase)
MSSNSDRGGNPARRSAAPAQGGSPASEAATGWRALVARFQTPSWGRAAWQLTSTLLAYAAAWAVMLWLVTISAWFAVPMVPLAALLLVRIFIIFHDCGHGSFFPSKTANDLVGAFTGMLTFTPYRHWRGEHAIHHGSTGDLDRRGIGDVWTMTVREYLDATPWRRFLYRMARNPVVLFVVAPFLLFVFWQRLPRRTAPLREKLSVWTTDVAVVAMCVGMGWLFGFGTFLILQAAVIAFAGTVGVWLFYLQHQYEDAYWQRGEAWDYVQAALKGSSFLALPKVLQWFSGNIGFHHIHHLSPRIPNYHLERCHASDPLFQQVQPMTLRSSVRSLWLRLWDEDSQRLVPFSFLRQMRAAH